MNTENYEQFGRANATTQSARFETYSFTLDPSETGFYVALQDTGTCVGISRLRVYRYTCPSRQVGLVLYPETPAPASGSVNVYFTCVDNASIPESESDTVICNHNGMWSTHIPVCVVFLDMRIGLKIWCQSVSVSNLHTRYIVYC